ncbi:MAG: hypothetical protein ABI969_09505, partial [bacterium]
MLRAEAFAGEVWILHNGFGEVVSMQGAVSTALELPTTRRPRTNRLDRAASPVVSTTVELSHEIHPVAFIDLTAAGEVVEDVIPRDRSEALCRAVNVMIA